LLVDAPAVKEIALPAPLVLLPTDTLIAPPIVDAEEPLVMEIDPADPLLKPVAITTLPESDADDDVVAPVPIVTSPELKLVELLAAVCIVIAPLAPASEGPLVTDTPPPD
jgi:hypothetical protein